MKNKPLSPPQIIVLSFLSVILLGTILLSLPISTAGDGRLGVVDSLFTATSATCVTGLVVKDTGSYFSGFGKGVILLLMQVGGLGIMTFSTMFAILLGRKLSISQNIMVQSALDHSRIDGLKKLVLYIVLFTVTIEAIGAALLFFRWKLVYGWGSLFAFKQAVFHAVSAFCNAGFSMFTNSMTGFRGDNISMVIVSTLIILGGIGFVVLLDFRKVKFLGKGRAYFLSKISLQTKIAVLVTAVLIILGALGFLLFERNGLLAGMPGKEKLWSCLFTSITSRTAGFNVIQTGALRPVTLFMITLLMFVGASPGSTGGG
ncbi:MAG: potassium transporter TrkG, partial [Candidatus Omnitrophota bacterium]